MAAAIVEPIAMGNNDERWGDRRGGASKPQQTPGISPTEARDLRAQVSALSSRVEKLEKFLKEHFDEKNQWNSMVREWTGKKVAVEFISAQHRVIGDLLWLDRYTICVNAIMSTDPFSSQTERKIMVIHKAAVALIYLVE